MEYFYNWEEREAEMKLQGKAERCDGYVCSSEVHMSRFFLRLHSRAGCLEQVTQTFLASVSLSAIWVIVVLTS